MVFPINDPDLEALWLFENGPDDEIGQNDLTASGSITYSSSIYQEGTYSAQLAASANFNITDANLVGIDFSSDFTVGGYARVASEPNDSKFISKWDAVSNLREFDLTREADDDSVYVSVSSDGASSGRVDLTAGASTWPLNTWVHLVVTFDATTHIIRLYKDGSEVTTGDFPYTWDSVPYNGAAAFGVGGSPADSNRTTIGNIDECFFVSRVLTSTEISEIYSNGFGYAQPYADSSHITGITFDSESIVNLAPGSDNWPVTWADDGHQYVSWGDGGGFDGTDTSGRVSMGIGRVEGTKDSYTGYNVNGGYNPENTGTWQVSGDEGKSHGIISIDGTMYLFRDGNGSDENGYNENVLYKSTNRGATWTELTSVAWTSSDFSPTTPRPFCFTFIQFGQDYDGARDSYVYIAMSEVYDDQTWNVQTPGRITLMRVAKTSIETKSSYEWFSGTYASPAWSSDPDDRAPIWQDSNNGIMRISLSYNAEINRYLLTGQQVDRFTANNAHIGIYDAPEPWGPWTTVLFENATDYGLADESKTVFWNFSNKWASGSNFVMIGTLPGADEWGSIEGSFTVSGYTITAEGGSITLTGADGSLLVDRVVGADAGAFTITGQDASLLTGLTLTADGGVYSISGADAELLIGRILTADTSDFNITGSDATLTYSSGTTLTADPGVFIITGQDAELICGRRIEIESGSFAIAGADADLLLSRILNAESGAITMTGQDVTLNYSGVVLPSGQVSITVSVSKPDIAITASKPAITIY